MKVKLASRESRNTSDVDGYKGEAQTPMDRKERDYSAHGLAVAGYLQCCYLKKNPLLFREVHH